jgi:hypothetical protein
MPGGYDRVLPTPTIHHQSSYHRNRQKIQQEKNVWAYGTKPDVTTFADSLGVGHQLSAARRFTDDSNKYLAHHAAKSNTEGNSDKASGLVSVAGG